MSFDSSACFTDAVLAGCRWLQDQQEGVQIALLENRSDVELARRLAADSELGFGIRFETISSWVRYAWELLGDGRSIVDGALREILVRRVLHEVDDGLALTAGMADLVVALVAQGVFPSSLSEANGDAAAPNLSSREVAALAYVRSYRIALERDGLIDLSDAALRVASDDRIACRVAVIGSYGTTAGHQAFLDELGNHNSLACFPYGFDRPSPSQHRASELQHLLERLYTSAANPPVRPEGAVRFLLPSGDYASARLIAESIVDYLGSDSSVRTGTPRVVVAAKDPLETHRSLVPWLARAERPASCALSEVQPFEDTLFGRGFLSLMAFAAGESCSLEAASDFALSPLSGLSSFEASRLNARWRVDRLADRATFVRDLVGSNPSLQPLFDCLFAEDYAGASAALRSVAGLASPGASAWHRSMAAACKSAEAFFSLCEEAGTNPLWCIDLLRRVKVGVSGCVGGDDLADGEAPAVLVTSLKQASSLAPCSCGMLVLSDMSASSYPVKASEDSVGLLAEKLGLKQNRPDALDDHRRMVFRALEAACERVVLERPRFDRSASESYPSVSWEEIVDGYRVMGCDLDDGERALFEDDKATGLPRILGDFCYEAAEESLTGYAYGATRDDDLPRTDVDRGDLFSLADASEATLSLCPSGSKGQSLLSPSAIEAYLECPAKWFSERRLRLDSLDAQLGAREMGTFAHSVLRRTLEQLGQQGVPKVDSGNLPVAQQVLREVFDDQLAAQPSLGPSDCPLIPLDSLEREEVELLRRRLCSYLEREACLLPGFVPRHFELAFGEDEPFPYGGCLIRGSIDRVDVNERGQAVVLDYKSSAKSIHCLANSSPFQVVTGLVDDGEEAGANELLLPHRVQALIYAQVVRRLLGLEVVGALYVPYGKPVGKAYAVGAYDPLVLGEADIPGIKGDECGVYGDLAEAFQVDSFYGLLDAVEQRIEGALCGLHAGDIAPKPRGDNPCSWCSFLSCPERR